MARSIGLISFLFQSPPPLLLSPLLLWREELSPDKGLSIIRIFARVLHRGPATDNPSPGCGCRSIEPVSFSFFFRFLRFLVRGSADSRGSVEEGGGKKEREKKKGDGDGRREMLPRPVSPRASRDRLWRATAKRPLIESHAADDRDSSAILAEDERQRRDQDEFVLVEIGEDEMCVYGFFWERELFLYGNQRYRDDDFSWGRRYWAFVEWRTILLKG